MLSVKVVSKGSSCVDRKRYIYVDKEEEGCYKSHSKGCFFYNL